MNSNEKSPNKSIHAGHRERVRENVKQNGFSQLEDHRLLELLLFFTIPRGDTNDIAHRLLERFGSLGAVLDADAEDLKAVDGIGENSALFITALSELFFRMDNERNNGVKNYANVMDINRVARSLLMKEKKECVYLACFDNAMRCKKCVQVSDGDFDNVDVNLSAFFEAAISVRAAYVVIIHNHPESSCYPSLSDVDATRNICVNFRQLGMAVKDHLIVGENGEVFAFSKDDIYEKLLM